MFDIGFDEMLVIAVVAIVVIGPKDLPLALRTVGRWVAKVRKVSGHFRSGVETMIREAELEEMEKKWREQNEAIINAHPQALLEDTGHGDTGLPPLASAEAVMTPLDPPSHEAKPAKAPRKRAKAPEPTLPF